MQALLRFLFWRTAGALCEAVRQRIRQSIRPDRRAVHRQQSQHPIPCYVPDLCQYVAERAVLGAWAAEIALAGEDADQREQAIDAPHLSRRRLSTYLAAAALISDGLLAAGSLLTRVAARASMVSPSGLWHRQGRARDAVQSCN
jgi:hypothetical protein